MDLRSGISTTIRGPHVYWWGGVSRVAMEEVLLAIIDSYTLSTHSYEQKHTHARLRNTSSHPMSVCFYSNGTVVRGRSNVG